MKIYKIKSYCKVNLYLRVTKKLNNGYHSISSLITFCILYDTIFISKINSLSDKISFTGKFKKGINKKSNIVTKVLSLLRKKQLIKNETFKISIQKNIPHGSGLGGASSNAASLLNLCSDEVRLPLVKVTEKTKKEVEKALKIVKSGINPIKKHHFKT